MNEYKNEIVDELVEISNNKERKEKLINALNSTYDVGQKLYNVLYQDKAETIDNILNDVYTNSFKLILDHKEIKDIAKIYKENYKHVSNFNELLDICYKKFPDLKKLKSAVLEMQKQFEAKKTLQPAVLSECNISESLAKFYNLNKCVDLERTPITKIPIEAAKYMSPSTLTVCAGRYLYYTNDNNNYLFQYGNPIAGDAEICINGNKIKLEFKEDDAKAGEYDIDEFDSKWKLVPNQKLKDNFPAIVDMINEFNKQTNYFDEEGPRNFKNFTQEEIDKALIEYFTVHGIDLIVSYTKDNDLIMLRPEWTTIQLPDGRRIISTESSEIRRTGKNPKSITSFQLLKIALEKCNVKEDKDYYLVNINNDFVTFPKGRGQDEPTKLKLFKIFAVDINKVQKVNDNFVKFNKNDLKQISPTVSPHMKLIVGKNEIINILKIANKENN